jgi:Bacterial TniB protein
VELLIFDEFQHLVESGSRKTLSNVADWLKAVINETGIPMILFGMPCSDDLLCQNRQLKRRFMSVEKLSSFNWGNSADSQKDYRLFLATIDKQLPFPERSCLAERDIAHRFFCATRGNVGATMSLAKSI